MQLLILKGKNNKQHDERNFELRTRNLGILRNGYNWHPFIWNQPASPKTQKNIALNSLFGNQMIICLC